MGVRQLESMVRISESLAKMQLSEEANEEHVKEAVRLFKVSTLKALKEGGGSGADEMAGSGEYVENIQKAERNIKRRLPIGSKTNVSKLVSEMSKRSLAGRNRVPREEEAGVPPQVKHLKQERSKHLYSYFVVVVGCQFNFHFQMRLSDLSQ